MRILIVDDEAPARTRLAGMIGETADNQLVGEAANGREALRLCARHEPDVVLLDIRMPGMDGLETARHLAGLEQPPAVIFTTAYGDHALEAFAAEALDYLLKPIRKQRLEQALQRVRRLNRVHVGALEAAAEHAPRTHLCARNRGELVVVAVDDVRCFQAEQKYVVVHHVGGQILIEESLKALEQEFGTAFLRIHRNALVATGAVTGLERSGDGVFRVHLLDVRGGLEVSRRHLPGLRRALRG